ncbi:MAG: hypothetical protein LBV40_06030, partial [Methanomicrobiales archaeon]|nr:hypothetical protein [Methanomicrobiales archaeon]
IFFPKIQVFSGTIENLPNEYQSKENKLSLSSSRTFSLNNVPIVYDFSAQIELQNNDYVHVVCLKDWFKGRLNAIAVHNASTNACYYSHTFILNIAMLVCFPILFFFGALFLLSPLTSPITLLFWGAIPVGIWGWLNSLRAKKIVLEFQKKQKKQIVP